MHLALFDLYHGGHHPHYLRMACAYWVRRGLAGRLDVVVTERFTAMHPDVCAYVEAHRAAGLRLVVADGAAPLAAPGGLRRLYANDRAHGRALRRYAAEHRPDACILMYFDHGQLSLGMDLRGLGCRLSGIYFRPSFHYPGFGDARGGLRTRLLNVRKQIVLAAALRNPAFDTLFCLDPYAAPRVRRLAPRRVRITALPDGVPLPEGPPPPLDRAAWGAPPGRKIALMFGALDHRKGVLEAVAAFGRLAPETQRLWTLALVGAVAEGARAEVHAAAAEARRTTETAIVLHDAYVPEEAIDAWIGASDLVLLPYRGHVGSSGVLVRAAGWGKPVLGGDTGLVGEHIRRRRLGYAVDSSRPEAIAEALAAFTRAPEAAPFSPEDARAFARAHDADAFAAALLHGAGVPLPE